MSQIIVCLKKYAKILPTTCCIRLELQTRVTRVRKTTNMADMRAQRTGRERNLSDKQSMSNLMGKKKHSFDIIHVIFNLQQHCELV